ncbi:hypothetical protein C8R47DRAFT_1066932 [Mycena vitilis]|nr:hypothetical protein C8R47DRAFT_1066932 [Mycena vitilis]
MPPRFIIQDEGTIRETRDDTGRGASRATQFQTDPKLSNAQVMRLLSGHWSLVSLWERLRRAAPAFECGCGGKRGGVAGASKKVNALSSAAVLALLGAMRELLAADQEMKNSMPPRCRLAALEAVKKSRFLRTAWRIIFLGGFEAD